MIYYKENGYKVNIKKGTSLGRSVYKIDDDKCIKIAATPLKCSWTSLGTMDDVLALRYSSNVFQFKTAIKVGGGVYEYNKPLNINKEAFEIYA